VSVRGKSVHACTIFDLGAKILGQLALCCLRLLVSAEDHDGNGKRVSAEDVDIDLPALAGIGSGIS